MSQPDAPKVITPNAVRSHFHTRDATSDECVRRGQSDIYSEEHHKLTEEAS